MAIARMLHFLLPQEVATPNHQEVAGLPGGVLRSSRPRSPAGLATPTAHLGRAQRHFFVHVGHQVCLFLSEWALLNEDVKQPFGRIKNGSLLTAS